MSRRDTIIVAVLINTGLLAILFMMAIHTDTPEPSNYSDSTPVEIVKTTPPPQETKVTTPAPTTPVAARDELDQVIQNYSQQPASPPVVKKEDPKETPKQVAATETPKATTPEPETQYVDITVKRGDYLEKIARANSTTISAIMHANNLPTARIDVGQVLRVPVNTKKKVESKLTPAPQPRNEVVNLEPQYYTIKSGDNPWKIAKTFHVRFNELLKMNDLDEAKARNLKPGDVLRVQ